MIEEKLVNKRNENSEKTKLLEISNLKTYFYMSGDRVAKAVDGVSFTIHNNETLAIVGESGSGKSITALSILRLIPSPPGRIIEGSIKLNGTNLLDLPISEMNQIRGNEIGMIFQEPMTSLDPVFTIGNQMAESLMKHQKLNKKQAYEKAVELLKLVGFARAEKIVNEYPHQLSGGMRQRVMIAIAMSCNPKLLIADEPTTALDVTTQAQILDLMIEMKETFDSSILLITHDLGVVAEVADRVIVMYGGQVVENATVKELFTNPKHPYTVALLKSVPSLDTDAERLEPIPGNVPPAHSFPQGCRFADRCIHAHEQCFAKNPDLINLSDNHQVRCHLYEEKGGSTNEAK